ncbi:MAG: hypothetical protein KDM63_10830, partial [Verrucomicrobiae bacterium]|nr:hypothetical protein [Verrucomicrobiae bacterium]
EKDSARLRQLAELLGRLCPEGRFTLDGNEQFQSMAAFREHWERHLETPGVGDFLSGDGLIFVEQPVHRDMALAASVGSDLAKWPEAPPLIIDESDATLRRERPWNWAIPAPATKTAKES